MFSNKPRNAFLESLTKTSPARIGIGHVGGRYPTAAQLQFKLDLAVSRDAVRKEAPLPAIAALGMETLSTRAATRQEYLMNTAPGRMLSAESERKVEKQGIRGADIQLIVSDGLSSEAFEKNVPRMLPLMQSFWKEKGIGIGTLYFVSNGRVAVMDHIGEILRPRSSILLIGERPGLGISDSLSAYFEFEPCLARVESDRNVLSNIHRKGVPPEEAALLLAEAMQKILQIGKSGMGVRFDFT